MEKPQYRVIITGDEAGETVAALRTRLAAVDGVGLCVLEATPSEPSMSCAGHDHIYALGVHDTPAFAVEKILDELAKRGWITMDTGALSPEEEEQIRARLQGLGYVD